MTYTTIQPPFTLKFREMSKKELKDYFTWFQEILPERIGELTRAVRETSGFELWQADFTPASLELLGDWFVGQVETRSRTKDELQEIESRLSYPIEVSGEDLTNRTFFLAIDVGMYLSQVFLKNYPTLRWNQLFGNKKSADYGQPILVGFSSSRFNPTWMLVTFAYGVASKRKTGKSLRDLYNIWTNMI